MLKLRNRLFLGLTILIIICTSCGSPSREVIKTVTISPSPKPSLVPSIIPSKTISISQKPTATLSPSPKLTIMPTWTPIPTLEPTVALSYLTDLLQNNKGCKLPCWWGITPGKTTWVEANQFLESFTLYSYGIRGDPNGYQVAEFLMPFPADMGTIPYPFGIRNGIIEDIFNIYFGNLTKSYNLVEILITYGQPDDILVSAYYEPRYSEYMTEIAVFYLQQGILVEYFDSDGNTNGDVITKCPQKATYPWLALWAPSLELTIDEAASRYLDIRNWPPYRTLFDATGMDVETFYQTFKDPNNEKCLELSTSDWSKY